MSCPSQLRAASITASGSVGWAWIVVASSATVASRAMARPPSAITSDAWGPTKCRPSTSPVLASATTFAKPAVSPMAMARPSAWSWKLAVLTS